MRASYRPCCHRRRHRVRPRRRRRRHCRRAGTSTNVATGTTSVPITDMHIFIFKFADQLEIVRCTLMYFDVVRGPH